MPIVTKTAFLENSNNKNRFIQMLCEEMRAVSIKVKQSDADADRLIDSTAQSLGQILTFLLC